MCHSLKTSSLNLRKCIIKFDKDNRNILTKVMPNLAILVAAKAVKARQDAVRNMKLFIYVIFKTEELRKGG